MAEYYRAFREVAVRHERTGNGRDSLFILSETDNAENFRLMTFYDLDDDEVPTYRIMDTKTHNKYGHGFIKLYQLAHFGLARLYGPYNMYHIIWVNNKNHI